MRNLLALGVAVALLIALFALAGGLRRDAAAETPGVVVERFLRDVEGERYEKAAALLSPDLDPTLTPETLRVWKGEVTSGLGDVRRVHGKTEWISGEKAEATGVLESKRRERRLRFGLRRHADRWRIDRLDEFWGDPAGSVHVLEKWRQRDQPARGRRTASRNR